MTKIHAKSIEEQVKNGSMYPQLPNSSPGRNSVRNMCRVGCLFWTWQQWLKAFLILIYIIFLIVVLPWIIVNIVKDGFSQKWQLISIGGLFVVVSIPLCVWHILQHMLHFTKPILQRPIIRILWMVPIYAVNAVIRTFWLRFQIQLKPNDKQNHFQFTYSINALFLSLFYSYFFILVAWFSVSRAIILHG